MSKPVLWTSGDASLATKGSTTRAWRATGVSIDTRTLEPGDLFVAIVGPNFDGHAFVADALAKGAAAAIVAKRPNDVPDDAPLLVVADTLVALRALARAARERAKARVIGVTGSVGKTGTKEALRLVLSRQGICHATEGNLNNHWGLPLSLARMPADTDYAVLEMGMNHAGEIADLTELAHPHVAVITTVEAVHSAHFTSVERIADAKAEIFNGVAQGGVAVLNRDNSQYDRLAAAARGRGLVVSSFGASPAAEVLLCECELGPDGSDIHAEFPEGTLRYRVGVPGYHWVMNSLAVLAAANAVGADAEAAAEALIDLHPGKGRGERTEIALPDGSLTLIDDSYNASPVSMAAAFDILARFTGRRRIAVLGDMLELGADSAERHAALADPIAEAGIDLVFTAGADMERLSEALPEDHRGAHAPDSQALAPLVTAALEAGDAVLVKGSAGSRMGLVVEAIRALDGNG